MVGEYISKACFKEMLSVIKDGWSEDMKIRNFSILDNFLYVDFDDGISGEVKLACEPIVNRIECLGTGEAVAELKKNIRSAYETTLKIKTEGILNMKSEYLLENVKVRICNIKDFMFKDGENEDIVCKKYLDFYIYCSVELPNTKYEANVTSSLLQEIGVSEDEVFKAALKNLNENNHLYMKLICMEEGIVSSDGYDKEIVKSLKKYDGSMLNIENDLPQNEATVILMDDVIKRIGEDLEDNLLLLPSSKFDWIIMPAGSIPITQELGQLINIVMTVNLEDSEYEERLSNNVYMYDRIKDEIVMVSNVKVGLSNDEISQTIYD